MMHVDIDRISQAFLTYGSGKVYTKVIEDVERLLIEKALERSCGNQIAASRVLGLNRNTLHSKIKKLKISPEIFKQ